MAAVQSRGMELHMRLQELTRQFQQTADEVSWCLQPNLIMHHALQ